MKTRYKVLPKLPQGLLNKFSDDTLVRTLAAYQPDLNFIEYHEIENQEVPQFQVLLHFGSFNIMEDVEFQKGSPTRKLCDALKFNQDTSIYGVKRV